MGEMSYEEKSLVGLLKWIDEYGIEEEIKDILSTDGFDAASKYLVNYAFDGAEADRIVAHFSF